MLEDEPPSSAWRALGRLESDFLRASIGCRRCADLGGARRRNSAWRRAPALSRTPSRPARQRTAARPRSLAVPSMNADLQLNRVAGPTVTFRSASAPAPRPPSAACRHAGDFDRHSVAGRSDDASTGSVILRSPAGERRGRPFFVRSHQPRTAGDVGRNDGGEPAGRGHSSGSPALRRPSTQMDIFSGDQLRDQKALNRAIVNPGCASIICRTVARACST
jgi:hypothetical protein